MDRASDSQGPSRRRVWRTVLIVGIVVVAAARIAAPFVLQHAINRRLERIPDYTGNIGSLHLSVLRGAYRINHLRIVKREGDHNTPFFSAESIDFSLAWRDLVRGKVVGDIYVENGHLTFVNSSTKQGSQLETDKRWQDTIQDIFPIDITHCEIHRGVLRFIDRERSPQVNLAVHDLRLVATGLQNRPAESNTEFPAHITVAGTVLGDGAINIGVDLEPLADQPHFAMRFEIKGVELVQLNDFLRAYGHVDVSKGTLQVYLEAKAANGQFDGYLKPFLQDVSFENASDKHDNLGKRIWESLVNGVVALVKNHRRNELATQIPFSGKFEKPGIGVLATIGNMIENGFGHALTWGFNTDKLPHEEKAKLSETKG